MQKLIKLLRPSSGSAIVTSLVMGLVFTIIGFTILRIASRGSDIGRRNIEAIKSYWANEGYMRLTLRALSVDKGPGNWLPTSNLSGNVSFGADLELNKYKVTNDETDGGVTITIASIPGRIGGAYHIEIKSKMKGEPLYNITTDSNVVIKSLQRFAFFEDSTTDIVWRDFYVKGDFHSNGIIKIAENMIDSPHVTEEATTAGDLTQTVDYPDPWNKGMLIITDEDAELLSKDDKDWFKGRFPNYAHIGDINTDIVDPDNFSLARFSADSLYEVDSSIAVVGIRFNGAEIKVYKQGSGIKWDTVATPSQRIIKTFGKTVVWGTLTGKATIVTDNGSDIEISGPVKYTNSSEHVIDTTNKSDALALVSGHDIVVLDTFACDIPNDYSYTYSWEFKENGGTVHGCLFARNGGLRVDNIDSYTEAALNALKKFKVIGSALVQKDLDRIWELDNGKYKGLNCTFEHDIRFYRNMIAPPGIPFPRATDCETNSLMWVLASGAWKNRLESK